MPVAVDPFDELLRPPPNESQEDRQRRLAREEHARQVSANIDASIKAERQARRKKRIVRLLLLGQSESGKSTTLRQFQRLYTPTAFREERILWRAVIQLNIVRSVRTILDALSVSSSSSTFSSPQVSPYSSPYSSPSRRPPVLTDVASDNDTPRHQPPPLPQQHDHIFASVVTDNEFSDFDPEDLPSTFPTRKRRQSNHRQYHHHHHHHSNPSYHHHHHHHHSHHSSQTYYLPNHVEVLKSRLTPPIRHIEQLLISKLVPPNEDEATHFANGSIGRNALHHHYDQPNNVPPRGAQQHSHSHSHSHSQQRQQQQWQQEIFVRPTSGWKGALARARVSHPSILAPDGSSPGSSSNASGSEISALSANGAAGLAGGYMGIGDVDGCEELQETLHELCPDMLQLWEDPTVRQILQRKKIRLEEASGFFLNDLERVTSRKYMPSDDDVLKARLKTVGAAEYRFEMEVPAGRDIGAEWRIVDVGGSRSQRLTWAPFFDDVDAIIFLAPISGFDQVLAEDRTVNRLEDSVLLWKSVCSNKILANVDIILFLNKCDILDAKLKSGIRLAKYVRSYGDRDNDLDSVCKYMKSKFNAIHREHSPQPRKFYAFCTSVTDTTTTAGIIASVRDMVIRLHLKQSKLL